MARNNSETKKVDLEVAKKIHELRLGNGFSRAFLANKIGVTYQQLSKYETGENKITCGRLSLIAKALKKPVSYFFAEAANIEECPRRRLTLEVSKSFSKIKEERHQEAIAHMLNKLAN